MDINELNKTSVTALFSKLTSQLQFGGNAFAGLLARVGVDNLLSKTPTDIQTKPVENSGAKLRAVDMPSENVKKAPVAEKSEPVRKPDNKKVATADNKEAVSKGDSLPVKDSSNMNENEDVSVQENAVVVPMAAPVENILAPVAEADGVESFEILPVADGVMADGAELKGFDTAGWEAEALPAGVVDVRPEVAETVVMPVAEVAEQTETVVVSNLSEKETAFVQNADKGLDMKADETDAKILPVVAEAKDSSEAVVSNARTETVAVKTQNTQADNTAVKSETMNKPVAADEFSAVAKDENARANDSLIGQNTQTVAAKQAGFVNQNEDDARDVSADKEVEVQAAELSEMLDGQALQIEVDVKEEKIAYHNNRDLIKNRAALDEAVAALENAENEAPLQTSSENMSLAQNTSPVDMPAQPIVAAPVAGAVEETVSANTAEVSAVSLNNGGSIHAAAGGVEYANSAKAEANAKTNETSFRDVFKGMSKEAVDQIKVNITKSAVKGVDSINVRLKPEELGHIEIKMQIKGGKLQAQIISSRPETMEALQREAQALEKAFNEAGFQTDENSLSFSCRTDGQQADQNQSRENPLRTFIGEVFETEANSELLSAEAANQNWSAEKGLNIKV